MTFPAVTQLTVVAAGRAVDRVFVLDPDDALGVTDVMRYWEENWV